jgi:2-haloacid dehalogenase
MTDQEVLCFDVYGSTHNQHSIVETLAEVADVSLAVAEEMSELWVEHQIDYSMEVTLMDNYESWWSLTERAFEWVLDYYGIDLTAAEREEVMEAYNHLEFYEGIEPFERLSEAGHELYILSDGNPEMLETLAENSGFDEVVDGIVSVEEVGKFKPAPEVYHSIGDHVDRPAEECTMVATHTFDVAGAKNAGLDGILINRHRVPEHRLGFEPDLVVPSYAALADEIA